MHRIKGVKHILWQLLSALSVIEINKKEGQRRSVTIEKGEYGTGKALPLTVISKFIEKNNQQYSKGGIVGLEKLGNQHAGDCSKIAQWCHVGRQGTFKILHAPKDKQANKQSEEDILGGYLKGAVIES